jgi:hypothetical protein
MERPLYDDSDLSRLLEGLPVDEQLEFARMRAMSVQRTETVPVTEDDRDELQLIAAVSGNYTRERIIPWDDCILEGYAAQAYDGYTAVCAAERQFEVMRRIVWQWSPEHQPSPLDWDGVDTSWEPQPEQYCTLDTAIDSLREEAAHVLRLVDRVETTVQAWETAVSAMSGIDALQAYLLTV